MSLHVLLFTLHFIFIAIAFVEITRYRNSDIRFFRPQLPLDCGHLEFLPATTPFGLRSSGISSGHNSLWIAVIWNFFRMLELNVYSPNTGKDDKCILKILST